MKYKVGDLVQISRFFGRDMGIIIYASNEVWMNGFASIYKILWEDGSTLTYTEEMMDVRLFEVMT